MKSVWNFYTLKVLKVNENSENRYNFGKKFLNRSKIKGFYGFKSVATEHRFNVI